MHHMQQNVFLRVKDNKTFILIETTKSGEKKSRSPAQKTVKTNLKAACFGISYDKDSLEFQFFKKATL